MATPVKKKRAAERAKERDARTEKVYRRPVGAPQRRRATKDEPRKRADAKSRPTRETPADKRREKVAERDKRTEKVYKKREHRDVPEYASLYTLRENMNPDEVSRPYATWRDTLPASGQTGSTTVGVGDVAPSVERDRPRPMIRAGVGPVAQLSSQAAHTYGYTPEAYNDVASIPTHLGPPRNASEARVANGGGQYVPSADGLFSRVGDRIFLDSTGGGSPGVLAHEQAHGWWSRQGPEDTLSPYLPGRAELDYRDEFNKWRQDSPNGPAGLAQQDMDAAMERGFYTGPMDAKIHPTELHARTVQFSPNSTREDWPDEIRPYYSGFLQGMDRNQDGSPVTPRYWRRW
jgi:hypothetical protein